MKSVFILSATLLISLNLFGAETGRIDKSIDTQKGHWGGNPEANGRILTASVKRDPQYPEDNIFLIHLEVKSQPGKQTADLFGKPAALDPLNGYVIFHLHESFPSRTQVVRAIHGVAKLDLIVFGAFTVGVEADDGNTQLELDLSQIPNIPNGFILN